MAGQSWATFEETVRGVASDIWGVEAKPEKIAETAIDCVLHKNSELTILVEITEQFSLVKVREDVAKLVTAKNHLFNVEHTFARCFCVVNHDHVTTAMIGAGAAQKISVMSIRDFKQHFFAFERYSHARRNHRFGSAVDPETGKTDEVRFISTSYKISETSKTVDIKGIADLLIAGKKIVMTGPYGAGKSRCVYEIFKFLSELQEDEHRYPIAVDLRETWGLVRSQELIRRHFDDMGLDEVGSDVLRGLPTSSFIFLLDGFDEIGSQAWSRDAEKLRSIRAHSLEGVKSLLTSYHGGALITGREHYFDSTDEMLQALGLDAAKTVILWCEEEFSLGQLDEYFKLIGKDIVLPSWLPRRPLICKTIAGLNETDFDRMFDEEEGDVGFWHHFIKILCERDSAMSITFESGAIYSILQTLAHGSRSKASDVGPISLVEVQQAFESVLGQSPIEQASVMLQRLPGLGRVEAESSDRQFLDTYILNGLRATAVAKSFASHTGDYQTSSWLNPLDRLGQRILGQEIRNKGLSKLAHQSLVRSSTEKNRTLASDIVGGLQWSAIISYDYKGIHLDGGQFRFLDLECASANNLKITNSIIDELVFPTSHPENLTITNTDIGSASGITSTKGLPGWIIDCTVHKFQSMQNVSRIRQIGLSPAHEALVTIIRKTFFQRGAGRKEEALLRGLGHQIKSGLTTKIINNLITNRVLERFQGDEGWVYKPNRSLTARMDKMLSELNLSVDQIWLDIGVIK